MGTKQISELPNASTLDGSEIMPIEQSSTARQATLSQLATLAPAGPTGPTGPAGPQGDPGTDGASILNGSGAPSAGLGVDGDYYLDTAVTRLYGPKTGGSWGAGVSLIGATGSTGPAGADGSTVLNGSGAPSGGTGVDGDFYIDTTANDLYGPKTAGVWGSGTSLIGPTGATGAQGDTGATGATGPGVASGGTTGQVLAKASATDYDTEWVDAGGGGGGGAWTFIERITLGSPASSVDFTSIAATYDALKIVYSHAATNSTNAVDWINLRVNNASTNVYHYQIMRRPVATGSPTIVAGTTYFLIRAGHCPGDSGAAGYRASGEILLPGYANSVAYKQILLHCALFAASTADFYIEDAVGQYNSTSTLISQVNILPGGGSFVSGFTATLLGLNTS